MRKQKVRAKASRADRRSGKSTKTEGKVSKSTAKGKEARSSKKVAAVKKRDQELETILKTHFQQSLILKN